MTLSSRLREGQFRGAVLCGMWFAMTGVCPEIGWAQVLLTQQEALRLAFPEPAEIGRRTAFLTEEQLEEARRLVDDGVEIEQRVVTYYIGSREGELLGAAYFDGHRVRTLPEVLMVVVSPEHRIERIEILKFMEPPEYRAPEGWLEQFEGRGLAEGVSLKAGIVGMTGATLTAQAVTRASRRVLALHRVIRPFEESESEIDDGSL